MKGVVGMGTKRKTMKTVIKQVKTPMPLQRKVLRQFALLEPVFDFFFGVRFVAFFAMPQISVFEQSTALSDTNQG